MKILLVAMADSVHTSNWLLQFREQEITFVLFPSSPHRRLHQGLKEMIKRPHVAQVSVAPMMSLLALPMWLVDVLFGVKLRARYLRFLTRRLRPDIIHGLHTQSAGYLISDSIKRIRPASSVWLTLWGSDLVRYQNLKKHQTKLRQTLGVVDYLGVECKRDLEIAKVLGFCGAFLPIVPASGGLEISDGYGERPPTLTSERKKIMVKGYSGFVGRALVALSALEDLSSELGGYEIHIYSASLKTVRHARRIVKRTNLEIVCHRKHRLSHSSMLALFRESRLSISLSLSDGFPGSLREAMATGCFPIESIGSCGDEWAETGKSALFVDPDDHNQIVTSIHRALSDDSLVNNAAISNQAIARTRFTKSSLLPTFEKFYQRLSLDASPKS